MVLGGEEAPRSKTGGRPKELFEGAVKKRNIRRVRKTVPRYKGVSPKRVLKKQN